MEVVDGCTIAAWLSAGDVNAWLWITTVGDTALSPLPATVQRLYVVNCLSLRSLDGALPSGLRSLAFHACPALRAPPDLRALPVLTELWCMSSRLLPDARPPNCALYTGDSSSRHRLFENFDATGQLWQRRVRQQHAEDRARVTLPPAAMLYV